tara:strand:- start:1115 stop:2767 length:1653 start_codon:yes stop_codon:yes gene_type:complete
MATKTYKINIDVESKTLGQLEDELGQINEELKQVDRNSDAFKELAQKSQALTSEIEKTNNAIAGLKLEDKLQAADGAIKVFGGSLQTVVGTLGALGIESEVFGEFEKKAASAIAVGMGIKDVSEGFGQFTMVMKKSGIAAKIFGSTVNKALIATGIGAFIVSLGLIVAYWDDITQAIGGASKETRDFLTDQEAVTEETIAQLDLLNQQDNILKLQGLSEEDILNKKIAQTDEILLQLQLQKRAAKEVADEQIKNTARVMGIFTGMGATGPGGLIGKLLGYSPEGIAEIAQKSQEQLDLIDEQIIQIENTRAGYILRKQALTAEDDEVEVTQYREKVETVNAITKTKGVVALETAGLEVQALDTVAIANLQAAAADRQYKQAQQASQEQNAALQQALGATAGALQAVGGVLDQESTAAKALAIGSAIINTYLGVTQALSTPAVPFIEPFATITRIANVAIVLASGLKAVQQIKKTPPKASSAGGAANVAGGRGAAASPNAAATAMRTQAPRSFDTPQQFSTEPTVRAYVVAGDVSSSQEADAKISQRRTIG